MADRGQFEYDVFISYSHKDEEWVSKTLLPMLEAAGLKVCIDFRDFEVGRRSIYNMQDATSRSRRTMLVITEDWLSSEWTGLESVLAYQNVSAGEGRIIPVLLKPCKLPKEFAFIDAITRVDFTRPDREQYEWIKLFRAFDTEPPEMPAQRPPSHEERIANQGEANQAVAKTPPPPPLSGFDAAGSLGLSSDRLGPAVHSFFVVEHRDVPSTAIAKALADRRYEEASSLARTGVINAITHESLRLAAVANLVHAAAESRTAAPEAQAGMCLAAMAESPALWVDAPYPRQAIALAFEVVEHLARQQHTTYSDEGITGDVSVADFVQAERESARILAGAGGIRIDTPVGRVPIAYGFMFAKHFGGRRRLESQALEMVGPDRREFFSPLFGYYYLERQGLNGALLARPPGWVTPSSELFAEVAQLFCRAACRVLERDCRLDRSSVSGDCCLAIQRLQTYRQALTGEARQLLGSLLTCLTE